MFFLLILLTICGYLIWKFIKFERPKNFPPGPTNYPFVGAGLFMSSLKCKTATEAFDKLGKIFGPVTGLYLGKNLGIITNGYEACKELLSKDEFGHRPENLFLVNAPYNGQQRGVFFSNGHLWQTQRRFTIRSLRDFGFGKSGLEGLIHEEIHDCISEIQKAIKSSSNSVITIHDRFGVSLINILWTIMSGARHSYDDEDFKVLLTKLEASFRTGNQGAILINTFPVIRFIPGLNYQYKTFMDAITTLHQYIRKAIVQHSKSRDENHSRDFIDDYLNELEKEKNTQGSTFFEEQLVATCSDLFGAGAESTSNTIAFGLLYMILYPEIQEKVHQEIDAVVGTNRLPSYNDFQNLPYTEAVLNEALRISPIAPVSVPHSNIEGDAKLMGYDIPKNTFCMANLRSVHMEKSYWGDPEKFRPERLIDPKTGKYQKSDRIMAFSLGRRMCLGESLARTTYYLFFTTILQRFKLELGPPGSLHPKPEFKEGFTVSPYPFEAKVTPRF